MDSRRGLLFCSLACSRSVVSATPWPRTAVANFCGERGSVAGNNKPISAGGGGEADGARRAASGGRESCDDPWVAWAAMAESLRRSVKGGGGLDGYQLGKLRKAELRGNRNETWQGVNASSAGERSGIPRYTDAGRALSSSNESSNHGSHMTAGTDAGKKGTWLRAATAGKGCIDGSEALQGGAAIPDKNCPCGAGHCVVFTANTERNHGRRFYSCPKRREGGGCGFFQWCDETNDTGTKATGYTWKVGEGSVSSGNPTGGSVHCFKCGMDGHWYKDCPNLLSVTPAATSDGLSAHDKRGIGFASTSSSSACFKCGQTGHWSKYCPSLYPGPFVHSVSSNDAVSGSCFRCGGKGHWSSNCPGVSSSGSQIYGSTRGSGLEGEGRSSGRCYNCGGQGHWASNCTEGGKDNEGKLPYWMN